LAIISRIKLSRPALAFPVAHYLRFARTFRGCENRPRCKFYIHFSQVIVRVHFFSCVIVSIAKMLALLMPPAEVGKS